LKGGIVTKSHKYDSYELPADGDSAIGSKHYPLNGWIVATPTAITIFAT
jgi:hypothetical protein